MPNTLFDEYVDDSGKPVLLRKTKDNQSDVDQIGTRTVQTIRTSSNIVLAIAAAFTDLDPTGTAAARDLDVVLPNMKVGDGFDFRPYLALQGSAGSFFANLAVIKAGVVQRSLFGSSFGNQFWSGATTSGLYVRDSTHKQQVLAGDLEADGSLRLRMQYIKSSATSTIAITSDFPLVMEGRGPFV